MGEGLLPVRFVFLFVCLFAREGLNILKADSRSAASPATQRWQGEGEGEGGRIAHEGDMYWPGPKCEFWHSQ